MSHYGEALPFPEDFFDRVLTDVPCSGDGTVRKAPKMRWRPAITVPLHCTQVRMITPTHLALPKVDTICTASSLIPTVNGNTVRSFSTHGQLSAATPIQDLTAARW